MAQAQTPQDHENDAMKNNIRGKFEKMFADQEPPAYASLREVEAMKARIQELETELARNSETQPESSTAASEKTDRARESESQASFSSWIPSKVLPQGDLSRGQSATRVLSLFIAAIALSLPIYIYWAVKTGAWQIYAITAGLIFSGVLIGFAISRVRRNRVETAMEMMVVNACLIIPLIVSLLSDVGVVLAATQFLIVLAIVGQSLSGSRATRALLVGFVASIVTLLIDFTAQWSRLSVPGLRSTIPFIALTLVVALGFLLVRQFRNYSLRNKLVVAFVAVALVSISAVGYVTNQVAAIQFNEELGAHFNELATRMARETSDALLSNKLALEGLVLNKFVQDSVETANIRGSSDVKYMQERDQLWATADDKDVMIQQVLSNEVADELRELQDRLPQYAELFVTDSYGAVIAATDRTSDYYQADEDWWKKAWNNGKGHIFISQPEFDESAGVYAVDIALPIPAHNRSEFVGVLRATVNINQLTNLLAAGQFGQTGQAVLVLPNHQYITNEIGVDVSTLDAQTIAGISSIEGTYARFAYNGTPSLVSKASVAPQGNSTSGDVIRELGWTIVIHQDIEEANQPITATTRGMMLAAIGVLIATGLLALLIGGQLSKPIENLTNVAEQIREGNLLARANENSTDEIGALATTFNRMTVQLRETLTGMEQRVAERTRDLELASEVGTAISQKVGDIEGLLAEATELIRDRFHLYYTQIYLVDAGGRTLVLRAGTGEVGQKLMTRGHRLLIGSGSLNGRAASNKKAVIVTDTAQSASFLPNPLLPKTRSEMSVPLVVGEKVLGVLDMQSERPGTFNETNLPAFEALAGQLSIAIQNASLFAEAERAHAEVEERARQQTHAGWQEFLNAIRRGEAVGYAFDQKDIYSVNPHSSSPGEAALSVPISVTGAEVGVIELAADANRVLSATDAEVAQATASILGNHIDSLRLLAQAEEYRTEAEQAARRLTSEGWQAFLKTRKGLESGYMYDLNQVRPLVENHTGSHSTITQPLLVQEEMMGELAVGAGVESSQEVEEIVAAVAAQLSEHIENLRLLEQTQERSLELEETQTFLESVIDSMPNMLFVKDAEELRFVRWNKAAEEIVGFTQEEMLGKNDYDFFSKEEADFFTSKDREVLTGGEPIDIPEEPLATSHRGERFMHTRKAPVYGLDGKPKYLLGLAEDITEQKHAAEALARRATELATVAQVNSTASTVLDPDKLLQAVVDLTKERFDLYHTHIYLTNEAWNTLLLAAGAGKVGQQMVSDGWNISIDHEESIVARAARTRQSVIANDLVRDAGSSYLSNQLLPDTRSEMAVPMIVGDKVLGVFDVQSDRVNYFSDADANIFTTLATQTAIALQNARLYAEQTATLTQLRELDRLKSSFLANMSHELRTPLNSILGFTDVMLEGLDGDLTEYMDNDLRLIQKNGQHLLHLINDVLDMAKIESGRMNLHPETFTVHSVLDEVTSITSTLASEKNLSLFIDDNSDREIEIYADNTRLRQVMINLVNNAIKFTEKGKIILSANSMEGGRVLITVKDTGIGIPPEKLEAIFQEFTQVDTSTTRKAGGTGLGLPISRRLVEMHGGRLWAESSGIEGEGSSFHVEMPIEARISEVIEKQEK